MKVSEVINTLRQAPGAYPVEIEQSGQVLPVLAVEYSHDPARAVLRVATNEQTLGAQLAAVIRKVDTLREANRRDKNLEDVQQMLKGALTCWNKVDAEESTERCESECSAPVVAHDDDGIPLCKACADDLAKEPEATIAEIAAQPSSFNGPPVLPPVPSDNTAAMAAAIADGTVRPAVGELPPAPEPTPKPAPAIKRHRARKEDEK